MDEIYCKSTNYIKKSRRYERLVVISDYHNVVSVLRFPENTNIEELRKEYENILYPGENPYAYDTPKQDEWLERVRLRESHLIAKYGGTKCGDGKIVYSPFTFVNWLVKEKGAKKIKYSNYGMYEFD